MHHLQIKTLRFLTLSSDKTLLMTLSFLITKCPYCMYTCHFAGEHPQVVFFFLGF